MDANQSSNHEPEKWERNKQQLVVLTTLILLSITAFATMGTVLATGETGVGQLETTTDPTADVSTSDQADTVVEKSSALEWQGQIYTEEYGGIEESTANVAAGLNSQSVFWTDSPPTTVEEGESFQVSVSGEADNEVCLVDEGFTDDKLQCESVSGSFSHTFWVDASFDLNNEDTDLYIGVDDTASFGYSFEDTTSIETVEVVDPIDPEVYWTQLPPSTVNEDESFEVTVSGEADDEVCLVDEGLTDEKLQCESVSGSFSHTFWVDAGFDLNNEDTDLYVGVDDTASVGYSFEDTTYIETVEVVDPIDPEVDWTQLPPSTVEEDESFEVSVSGEADEEVCLVDEGLTDDKLQCESVSGSFTHTFWVDAGFDLNNEDTDLYVGVDDTASVGYSFEDTTYIETVEVVDPIDPEVDWTQLPPSTVEEDESFEVTVSGDADEEVCLVDEGLTDDKLQCQSVSGEFTETFWVDAGLDLGNEDTELYVGVDDTASVGYSFEDTTSIETVEVVDPIDPDASWTESPPTSIDEDESFEVSVSGEADEEVCLVDEGLSDDKLQCESVSGSFTHTFWVDAGFDLNNEDTDLYVGVDDTASVGYSFEDTTSIETVEVVDPVDPEVYWTLLPPQSVEEDESFEVTVSGEADDEVCLVEEGLTDDKLQCQSVSGEFTETFWVDASLDLGNEDTDLYVGVDDTASVGYSFEDTTSIETVEVVDPIDPEVYWTELPPSAVEEGDSFEVSVNGEADEEVCLVNEGLSDDKLQCESVSGEFTETFSIDASFDLGNEDTDLYVGVDDTASVGYSFEATTSVETIEVVDPVDPEVDWTLLPPQSVEEDESFEVTVSGDADDEVCLVDEGLTDDKLQCQSVSGEFTETFWVDASLDLGNEDTELYVGVDDTASVGYSFEDTTSIETVEVVDPTDPEVYWTQLPPQSVEEGDSFEVSVSGEADEEVCLVNEGLSDDKLQCESVSGSFSHTFWVDAGFDLNNEDTDLYVGVDDTASVGYSFEDMTNIETVEVVDPVDPEIYWTQLPPSTVEEDESFEVTVSGEADEEVCLVDEGLTDDKLQCQSVSGEFTETFWVDASLDLGNEDTDLYVGVDDTASVGYSFEDTTSIETVEVVDPIDPEVDWTELPPSTVEQGEILELTISGEGSEEVCLVEDGLTDDKLQCESIDGEFDHTFTVDTEVDLNDDETELYVGIDDTGTVGYSFEDTTTTEMIDVGQPFEPEVSWVEQPPAVVENGETFEVSIRGKANEEVCLVEEGLTDDKIQCESVSGEFTEVFVVDAIADLGTGDAKIYVGVDDTASVGYSFEDITSVEGTAVSERFDTELYWSNEPRSVAEIDESISVEVKGEISEEGEVCLLEDDGSSIKNEVSCTRLPSGEFSEIFNVAVASELVAGPGEVADLQAKVTEAGFGGETETTEQVPVEIESVEIDAFWTNEPPVIVDHRETFIVDVAGEIPDSGEVCLKEKQRYIDRSIECKSVSAGEFTEVFGIDATDDLRTKPPETVTVYAAVSEDKWFGESETTTEIPVELDGDVLTVSVIDGSNGEPVEASVRLEEQGESQITNSNGNATFYGEIEVGERVVVYPHGFSEKRLGALDDKRLTQPVRPGDDQITIELGDEQRVSGQLLDQEGDPLSNAQIEISSVGHTKFTTTTNSQGRFEFDEPLPIDTHTVWISGDARFDSAELVVEPGKEEYEIGLRDPEPTPASQAAWGATCGDPCWYSEDYEEAYSAYFFAGWMAGSLTPVAGSLADARDFGSALSRGDSVDAALAGLGIASGPLAAPKLSKFAKDFAARHPEQADDVARMILRSGDQGYNEEVLRALYPDGAYDSLRNQRGLEHSEIQVLARSGADLRHIDELLQYERINPQFLSEMGEVRVARLSNVVGSHSGNIARNTEQAVDNIAGYHSSGELSQQRSKEIIDSIVKLNSHLPNRADDGAYQARGLFRSNSEQPGAVQDMAEQADNFGAFKGAAWETQLASRLVSQGHRVEELRAPASNFASGAGDELDIVVRMDGERTVVEAKDVTDVKTRGFNAENIKLDKELPTMRALLRGNDVDRGYIWVNSADPPDREVTAVIGDSENIRVTGPWDPNSPLSQGSNPTTNQITQPQMITAD